MLGCCFLSLISNNFYPVKELPPTKCEVIEGTLPSCLDGAYIRNGPNPRFLPQSPYHIFDGDGMLHAIRISQGKATLCSRYVKTYKYNIEKDAGFPIMPFFFSGYNSLTAFLMHMLVMARQIIIGQFDMSKGFGVANTNLAFFGDKLYALWESDLPYAIKIDQDGDIITLGRHDFDSKLMNITAHPKTDPVTKETFAFSYGQIPPFFSFIRFNERGDKQVEVPIFSATGWSFFHDFAITKNYAIFLENQIKMSPLKMIFGGTSIMYANTKKVPRIGVMPRYATNESALTWFDVPGLNIIHAINAWEEDGGDTVVMLAPNILSVEHALRRMDLIHGSVEKVRINLKTRMVSRHPLSFRNLEFGVINSAYVAKKNRYVYCALGDLIYKFPGVVKLDVSISEVEQQECVVASRMFGPGCFGGEPFFVAREPDNPNAHEDDGYIVTYVHNENTGESSFLVMDARSPTLEIIANVKLPGRVPYGFHGLFVKEKDINKL